MERKIKVKNKKDILEEIRILKGDNHTISSALDFYFDPLELLNKPRRFFTGMRLKALLNTKYSINDNLNDKDFDEEYEKELIDELNKTIVEID